VRDTADIGVNRGGFGDELRVRVASPLSITLEVKVTTNATFARPMPYHRAENDTVLVVRATNANRLKEFWRGRSGRGGGCRRSVGVRRL
jgi:hypothetical protein